jgi:hypothetical protein
MTTRREKIIDSKTAINEHLSFNTYSELMTIYEHLEQDSITKENLIRIPIQIVACNESFFKVHIKHIIDYDHKFLERSKALIKKNNIKIEIEDVSAISNSLFSIGDLISYSLKYSSIDSIFKTYEEIAGFNFYNEFKKLDNSFIDIDDDFLLDQEFIPQKILKTLQETYKIRNVICHDFLAERHKLVLTKEDMKQYLIANLQLMEAIEYLNNKFVFTKRKDNDELTKDIQELSKELIKLHHSLESTLQSTEQKETFKNETSTFFNYVEIHSKGFGDWFLDDTPWEDEVLEIKKRLLTERKSLIEKELFEMNHID